MKEEH